MAENSRMDERQAFEAWATDVAKLDISGDDGRYEYDEVWWAFQAWQARAELALTTAPRDAGERLTDHERGQVNIAKCMAVTDSIDAYVWHHSVTQLLAIIARLTQKEPT